MNPFHQKEIKQIFQMNESNLDDADKIKINILKTYSNLTDKYPTLYSIKLCTWRSMENCHNFVFPHHIAPGTTWEIKIQKKIKDKDFYEYCLDETSNIHAKIIPAANGDKVSSHEIHKAVQHEFSYIKEIPQNLIAELFRDAETKENMKMIKLSTIDEKGNNTDFHHEIFDFLGNNLMKKIQYNHLNQTLGETSVKKTRKI